MDVVVLVVYEFVVVVVLFGCELLHCLKRLNKRGRKLGHMRYPTVLSCDLITPGETLDLLVAVVIQ